MSTLKIGDKIEFKGIDLKSKDVSFNHLDKITILSIFPKINTSVCDEQTLTLHKLAEEYVNFNFIALSLDEPKELQTWCLTHGVADVNLNVISDSKYKDFATKYDFIVEYDGHKFLDRAIIVLGKDSKILYIERKNGNIKQQIKFDALNKELEKLHK